MSGEISNVSNSPANIMNEATIFMKAAGMSDKSIQIVQSATILLSQNSVNVVGSQNGTDLPGEVGGATGIPALDDPADLKQLEEDLEKLIAFLQLDEDERQAALAKARIETQKDSMSAEHAERQEKIDESIQKMNEAAAAKLVTRIFGWIAAAIAVAAAIVTTIVTGGAAAAFAIAGAVVAVSALIASESGLTDNVISAITDSLMENNPDMKRSNAQLIASLIINLSIMALSLGCSIGGMAAGFAQMGKAVADTVSTVAKVIQTGVSIGGTAVGLGSFAAGVGATATGYQSELTKADLTELEKIMAELQRRLDESEEELNAILQAIQNALGQIAEILASATDTQLEIASQMGNMA